MMLTIHTLFNDPNIVNAVIQRVLQTRKDTIYWQQYLDFRRTTTRVFRFAPACGHRPGVGVRPTTADA